MWLLALTTVTVSTVIGVVYCLPCTLTLKLGKAK